MPKPALKADFIRSKPLDMPLKELQRDAKREGLGVVGKSYVQKVRSSMAAAARASVDAPQRAASKAPDASDPHEMQLRGIVVTLGTKRVRQIIDELEAQLMGGKRA